MKIGIITQPLEDNYGGILQNWALQQYIFSLGHNPITIDYGLKYGWLRYFLSCCKTIVCRLKGNKRIFPHRPRYGRYCSKYTSDFIHNNIVKTHPVRDLSYIILKKYNIDTIVVGSDQIWRPKYSSHVEDGFLEFANDFKGKRIAYAVSFGVDNWEYSSEQTEKCKSLVKKFDAISVREESGIKLCKTYLNIENVATVLDPTLLLSVDKYINLCKNIDISNNRFIAVYCIDITEERQIIINNVSKKLGIPFRIFSANRNIKLTIEEWLAMFRDAEFVITDSFHGTVFSIIFQKPFYTMVNAERGRSRFESLLSKIGLTDRMSQNCIDSTINWKQVNDCLCLLNNNSVKFLSENLK